MTPPPDHAELESRPCPNGCAAADVPVLTGTDRLHGVAGQFTVCRCTRCGLMRTNPRPTPESIGAFYPSDYAPYQTGDAPSAAAPKSAPKRWLRRLLGLEARSTPPMPAGRLLEIGCANGAYMAQMRHVGWEAEGIEFSEAVAQQARDKGFRVQSGALEAAQPPLAPVDLVAAWMVLEHLHAPVDALRRVRGWVRPGGYLIASVPDAGALERRLFGDRWYALQLPTHLYHYTPDTIRTVLASAGWQLTRIQWQRNCNNLLWSLEYLATDKAMPRLLRTVRWLRMARSASKLRILLGWLLGVLRQSGRMEIWAQPMAPGAPADRP
jgi:SAM-dependent methyltransferase